MIQIPILTYHSANVHGQTYDRNDHIALEADLALIRQSGRHIISLDLIAQWLRGEVRDEQVQEGVGISFDDGCDYDYHSRDFPEHGIQPGFRQLLENCPGATATAFVLASKDARTTMDERALFGRGDMSDTWWRDADESGLIRIENHGWDHSHPDVCPVVQRNQVKGTFEAIDTYAECHQHVAVSATEISRIIGRRPTLFAYPFGNSSQYLRETYLPDRQAEHQTKAAFSTAGTWVTRTADKWNIPRFVCGFHWRSPDELSAILQPTS